MNDAPFDLVIANGLVVTAAETFRADVAVRGERIAAIGLDLPGRRVIDATDKLVIPGAVDAHVHLQLPVQGTVSADDWRAGTIAAACGGVTTIIDFADPLPGQPLLEALAQRRAEADGQAVIDYALHMVVADASRKVLTQLPAVMAAGVPTFKLFMAYEGKYLTDDQLYQTLRELAALNALAFVHAENYPIIRLLTREFLAAGQVAPRWHARSRPAITEGEAAGRVIALAETVGARACIAHISCAAVVTQIRAARARGIPVYGETCPQYLILTDEVYEGPHGERFVCSPPLRGPADQTSLWRALADGDLQVVSTDHCPFHAQDKERGRHDFTHIPGGVPGVETRLALLYDRGVRGGRLTLSQWVALCCTQPARLFGLTNKGSIRVGADADLVIFDPARTHALTADRLHSQIDYSIYEDITVTGWPTTTISRGQLLVEDGCYVGPPGHGRFVERNV